MLNIRIRAAHSVVGILALVLPLGAEDTVSCKLTDEILSELRQIRSLLERQAAAQTQTRVQAQPPAVTTQIDVGNAPFLGSKDAPITIVEFTDYQCTYCQRFHLQTFADLKKNYVDTGKVRFYSMDFPLDAHANALTAAQAARCAGEQGQFWAVRDRMQAYPFDLEMPRLTRYAQEAGIDVAAFQRCVAAGKDKKDILQGVRDATSKGVQGTPAFVIGRSAATGVVGELTVGAMNYGYFEEKLKALVQ